MLLNALNQDELSAIRARLLEQLAAEEQQGVSLRLPDGKQLVRFLINKRLDCWVALPEVLEEASEELLALVGFKRPGNVMAVTKA